MKYLKISNAGILDIRLVALMGGTTKANDKFKIGQFGSGLKYTMAFLFRNNLDFHIFAGEEEVKIHLEAETIREEKFEIICINGHRTSITTNMGADWKAWMIVRELWSNALDEGEAMRTTVTDCHGEPDRTTFYIQIDKQIQEVIDNWTKYFIQGVKPMFESDYYAIYPGGSSRRLYKNGILIEERTDWKCLFSYDIKDANLNELREYQGSASWDIAYALFNADEKIADYFLQHVSEEYYEGKHLSLEYHTEPWGKAWKNVIGEAKLIHPKALEHLKQTSEGIREAEGSLVVVPELIYKSLTKQFPGVSALRIASKLNEFYADHSAEAELQVKKALTILEACDYPMHKDLTFEFGYFADKKVLARVDLDAKKVFISNTFVQAPLHTVVAMLIEENEHYMTGFADLSREFQTHFINLYTRTLLAKNSIEI